MDVLSWREDLCYNSYMKLAGKGDYECVNR